MAALADLTGKRVAPSNLQRFCADAMVRCGLTPEDAALTADVLTTTDTWGTHSHGTFALLRLSDCVAERLDLHRWHIEPSTPKGFVPITPATRVNTRASAVTFTNQDLDRIGVTRELIAPFVLREEDRRNLISESTGHSSLERRPLVDFGDALVLTLPSAVSPAIRRFVLSELQADGFLESIRTSAGGETSSSG